MLRDKRKRLLGHTMRCEEKDPMFQVTFKGDGSFSGYDVLRVGRPRGHWAETTMSETFWEMEENEFERENIDHLIMIFITAIERKF